jgi:hypothetical protein
MVVAAQDHAYPRGLVNGRGVQSAPRVGFAYDPFGKGNTAIRGGFGVFYHRNKLEQTLSTGFATQTPIVRTPVLYYGTLSNLLSSTGFLFPQSVMAIDRAGQIPSVMNFSLSVQRNVGFGTVLEAAYVGSLGRHLLWRRNLNAIPYGTNFKQSSADPSNPQKPLASAFLRPLIGYENINQIESASSSNYHSLQVSANRRFARGVQFAAAWTWSKAMDFNSSGTGSVTSLLDIHMWNYGLSTNDRTHVLTFNWLWDIPKTRWNSMPARMILHGWRASSITSFISGSPVSVNFSTTSAADISGSPTDSPRINVISNPVLPKSERTFSRFFRTDAFQLPAIGTFGNASKTVIRGPGINNWDVALFKNLFVGEPARLEFRCEMYNAFNHTQFSSVNISARFDTQGRQVNAQFGELTAARNPRQVQLALRFYF